MVTEIVRILKERTKHLQIQPNVLLDPELSYNAYDWPKLNLKCSLSLMPQ